MALTESADGLARLPAAKGGRIRLSSIGPSSRYYWVRLLLENPAALVSLAFVLLTLIVAVFAPVIAPYEPTFVNPADRLQGPSSDYWFGTDAWAVMSSAARFLVRAYRCWSASQ